MGEQWAYVGAGLSLVTGPSFLVRSRESGNRRQRLRFPHLIHEHLSISNCESAEKPDGKVAAASDFAEERTDWPMMVLQCWSLIPFARFLLGNRLLSGESLQLPDHRRVGRLDAEPSVGGRAVQ